MKGYEVHGIIRRASTFNTSRIDHIYEDPNRPSARLFLHHGGLSSTEWILHLIYNLVPDELYHLAAQSHVKVSFDIPEYTGDITGLGTMRLLEAVRRSGAKTRFCQASSSEMFGGAPPPQNETTPFQPRSPYAAAKVYGIGRHEFIVTATVFMPQTAFSSTTRAHVGEKLSSLARSLAASLRFLPGRRMPYTSAISKPGVIGATHPNTSKPCGGSCSRNVRMIS